MATIKSYTDISQSKQLAEILSPESADYHYIAQGEKSYFYPYSLSTVAIKHYDGDIKYVPCWSLAALFSLIKDKCGYFEFVYLTRTTDGRANPLEDVYRLSTYVYDVYQKEAIDACIDMIEKLHELKML